jgi:hypothetical protein
VRAVGAGPLAAGRDSCRLTIEARLSDELRPLADGRVSISDMFGADTANALM